MTDRQLTNGSPVPEDDSHKTLRADGQQHGYVVLTPEERAKGFVQPVRRAYLHKTCGNQTTMGQSLAETYARNPWFYSGTFCCNCAAHFDLSQFVWVWAGPEESLDPLHWSDEKLDMVQLRKQELREKAP